MQGMKVSDTCTRFLGAHAIRRKQKADLSGRQDAVGSRADRHDRMADSAAIQRPSMSLQGDELDGISGLGAGCDGVCAVMAPFARNAAVPGRESVERIVLLEPIQMAAIAARFVEPGIRILGDLCQRPVAVDARHPSL